MQRLKVFGLACMAVFVLGAFASAMASAATTSLPFFSRAGNFTSTSARGVLTAAGIAITCVKDLDLGFSNGTTSNLGTYDINFEGCTSLGSPCTTEGDASGTILLPGTNEYHLVRLLGPTQRAGIWFLVKPLIIKCLLKVQTAGNVLGSLTPTESPTTKFTSLVNTTKEKTQEITNFQNNKLETVVASLTSSVSGGKSEPSTEASGEDVITVEGAAAELKFK